MRDLHDRPVGVAIRRYVDTRLVSYAMALAQDEEVRPALEEATRVCTVAVLQTAGGLVALSHACRGAANSPYIHSKFNSVQRERFVTLFGSIAESIDAAWKKELGQLMELLVLTGTNVGSDEEQSGYALMMAQAAGLDIRPFCLHEDDERYQQQERVIDDAETSSVRRKRRRSKSSKEIYQRERMDNLVSRCLALGITEVRALLCDGHVFIVGVAGKSKTEKLAKLRGSVEEGQAVCKEINEELRGFSVCEPDSCSSLRA